MLNRAKGVITLLYEELLSMAIKTKKPIELWAIDLNIKITEEKSQNAM